MWPLGGARQGGGTGPTLSPRSTGRSGVLNTDPFPDLRSSFYAHGRALLYLVGEGERASE